MRHQYEPGDTVGEIYATIDGIRVGQVHKHEGECWIRFYETTAVPCRGLGDWEGIKYIVDENS
jgi:hypothetical protein